MEGFPRVCFIKNTVTNRTSSSGDYTYYDDSEDFERNVLNHFPFMGDREVIAELEAIAWWDWPVEQISQHLDVIASADIEALRACRRD
ncbi:hypothetical protein SAMN06295888_10171 [Desulfonatronum zhilinae]|nr:hypothetical protein SAMN06295888_10171 [Desulfonatronum zhilinae]